MAYTSIVTIESINYTMDELTVNGFYDSDDVKKVFRIIDIKIDMNKTESIASFKTMLRELREDSGKSLGDLKGHKIKCYFGFEYNVTGSNFIWMEYYARNP